MPVLWVIPKQQQIYSQFLYSCNMGMVNLPSCGNCSSLWLVLVYTIWYWSIRLQFIWLRKYFMPIPCVLFQVYMVKLYYLLDFLSTKFLCDKLSLLWSFLVKRKERENFLDSYLWLALNRDKWKDLLSTQNCCIWQKITSSNLLPSQKGKSYLKIVSKYTSTFLILITNSLNSLHT